MSLIDTERMGQLTAYLDRASFRQGVIASNIANVDTPGYRTRDLDFGSRLSEVLGSGIMRTHEVPALLERPDGNNVSLEREGLLMAQTQLQFRTGIELLRAEFRRVQTAIQEGGR